MDAKKSKEYIESIIHDYKKDKISIGQAREKLIEHYLKLIPYLKEEITTILTTSQAKNDLERAEELANLKIFESMLLEG